MLKYKFEKALDKVQKPARYLGNELNSVHKTVKKGDVTFAFCFPDVYEVGQSHLGTKILYHSINERDDAVCERVFAPWTDMEEEMRKRGIPLLSLESHTPVKEFDIAGFTLQYEMSYTNILNMLDLAGIPLLASERKVSDTFVCAGGPCAYNAEPMADFLDFVLLGEGEEAIHEILDVFKETKGTGAAREEILLRLARIEGVYVPSFYDVEYNDDNTVKSITKNRENVPAAVRKRIVKDLNKALIPREVIVPFMEIVHDRVMLELFRGCSRGCRFCQAGYIYRPVRERDADLLTNCAGELINSTGYDEISLSSLSTADYSELPLLTDNLLDLFKDKKVSLSLPSLRVDNFSIELMQKVQKVRKSGLTFAPEAGTQRLRDVINKNVTEDDLINTALTAFKGGFNGIKLYFMIGLPTETGEDIEGIAILAKKTLDAYYTLPRESRSRAPRITVSASSFVPKAFTPFQWEGQNDIKELSEKQKFLKSKITAKTITYNYHQSEVSYLEAVFARGDRRLSKVILSAYQNGCKFDGWSEYFNYDVWMNAFAESGINPDFYALRQRSFDEVFPWEHIDIGVRKEHLINECKKAKEEKPKITLQCREKCTGCGATDFKCGVCYENKA